MSEVKVVIITGASRGFGQAAALLCAQRGHTVIGTMRNPDRDAAGLQGQNPAIEVEQLDVTDDAAVQRVISAVAERHGRIDVLVNNAGYGLYGPVEDVSDDQMQRQFDTNLFGQIRMVRAVLPVMRQGSGGKIVNTSSLAGRVVGPLMGLYAASKWAVEGMSEALRYEAARFNVQVTILEPGMFRSDLQTTNLDVAEKYVRARVPTRRASIVR